jgi:hypothetical protein
LCCGRLLLRLGRPLARAGEKGCGVAVTGAFGFDGGKGFSRRYSVAAIELQQPGAVPVGEGLLGEFGLG